MIPRAAATETDFENPTAPSFQSAAMPLRQLDPGAYTALVSGANNTSGVALVEIYETP